MLDDFEANGAADSDAALDSFRALPGALEATDDEDEEEEEAELLGFSLRGLLLSLDKSSVISPPLLAFRLALELASDTAAAGFNDGLRSAALDALALAAASIFALAFADVLSMRSCTTCLADLYGAGALLCCLRSSSAATRLKNREPAVFAASSCFLCTQFSNSQRRNSTE